jgi:RNA polymerase sigma-70 factor (ECF subfamily)
MYSSCTVAAQHQADLELARACLAGDAAALARLDAELARTVERAVRKVGGDRSAVDEIAQRLRERLIVGTTEQPPRLTEYSGRGPLGAWLRVVATRAMLDLRRREKFEAPLGARTLDGLPAADHDPELQYLKANYRDAFRRAFRDAFAALEPLERDLIRRHHIAGDNMDELAAHHAVHRATVARWVARARAHLLAATRERLAASLGVPDAELDSILDLIASKLEVSLRSQI